MKKAAKLGSSNNGNNYDDPTEPTTTSSTNETEVQLITQCVQGDIKAQEGGKREEQEEARTEKQKA